ncbi:MAG: sugar transferase [Planctomycetaceae bacterium]|nr:sugar transferase [Planctomycetaceae bacterium]
MLKISPYYRWKYYFDFFLAVLLIIPAVLITAVAVFFVKLTSRGPCLYSHIRLGLDGRPFTIYKIRTMRAEAEAATGPVWTARDDKRITAVGKILRKTHIDDLPQFYNVLRGDMSLTGPRPERPEFVKILEKRIDRYGYRLFVKPGITGLAQLNLEPDTDLNDVRRKLVLDFEYMEKCSFRLDLRLLLCSAINILCPGSRSLVKFFRLTRRSAESPWAASLLPNNAVSSNEEERLSQILIKRAI